MELSPGRGGGHAQSKHPRPGLWPRGRPSTPSWLGERRRPPPSTPTQALPLLTNQDHRHPTNSSSTPLSNQDGHGTREHPGQAWPRPRAALGTPGERKTPARVCPHVHASHHARGPKGPGSTIRIRARSHPTTASQPWDHTGQARPVMPKAQPIPLPKFTHRDGGGKPFARSRHWPAKNRPTTHSPNPGGSRQSQRAAATGV